MSKQLCSRLQKKTLTLEEKVHVLDHAEKNPKVGCRKLAELFSVGKMRIVALIKDKQNVRAQYETFCSANNKRLQDGKYQEINEAVYQWHCLARDAMLPINGPMIREEATEIAKKLNKPAEYDGLKASSGWLECWKSHYGIKQHAVEGESGQVQTETVESWMERLKELCKGYKPEDIWNEDKTGCFFCALPDKSLAEEGRRCKGGKKPKLQMTVAFFVNAKGEKEEPIVIWKSKNPRCFENLRDKRRPANVTYFSNPKSWVNSEIMIELLKGINRRMRREQRKIILFVTQYPCRKCFQT